MEPWPNRRMGFVIILRWDQSDNIGRIAHVGWDKLAEIHGGPSQADKARIDTVCNAGISRASEGPPQARLARPTLQLVRNAGQGINAPEGASHGLPRESRFLPRNYRSCVILEDFTRVTVYHSGPLRSLRLSVTRSEPIASTVGTSCRRAQHCLSRSSIFVTCTRFRAGCWNN